MTFNHELFITDFQNIVTRELAINFKDFATLKKQCHNLEFISFVDTEAKKRFLNYKLKEMTTLAMDYRNQIETLTNENLSLKKELSECKTLKL